MKNILKGDPSELDQHLNMKEENWSGLGRIRGISASRPAVRGRGGGRPRGRTHKAVVGPTKSGRRNVRDNETLTQYLVQQGQRSNGQGQRSNGRGRRTNRRRRIEKTVAVDTLEDHLSYHENPSGGELPTGAEEWGGDEVGKMELEVDGDNSVEESESDNNAPAVRYEEERWDPGFADVSNRGNWDLMEMSDDDVEGSEEENGYEDEDNDDNLEGGDVEMNDLDRNGDEMEGEEEDEDDGSDSADSGEYSD